MSSHGHRVKLPWNIMSSKCYELQPFRKAVIKTVPVVNELVMNTTPMETYASNKRAKPEVSQGSETRTQTAWTRIMAKLLFILARVSNLLFQLMWPKQTNKVTPYSVWPMTKKIEATLSDIAESLEEEEMDEVSVGSYQMVEKMTAGGDAASQTSRASTGASSNTKAEPYLTEEDYRMLGTAPRCAHNYMSQAWMTKKQGVNYGRTFWRCPLARGKQCNFFQWTAYQPVWSEDQARGGYPGDRRMPTPSRESEKSYRTGSTTPQSSQGTRSPLPCQPRRTTRAGSNAFVDRTKCLECGKVIQERRREHYSPVRVVSESEENNVEQYGNPGGMASGSHPTSPTTQEIQDFEDYKAFRNWQRSKQAHGKK